MQEDKHFFHKKIFIWTLSALSIMLSVLVLTKIISEVKSFSVKGTQVPSITVSGEGKIFVKPDIGQVSVSVVREGNTVAVAQFAATEDLNKVMAALEGAGVDKKDIKTTGYAINPLYDYKDGERIFRGYEVRQSLEVKIRDLGKAGEILAAAAAAGVNQVGQLSFTVEDPDQIKAEARKLAIDDAKSKAKILAKDLGERLGDILSFNESYGGIQPIYREAVLAPTPKGAMTPEVPVGENEIVVNVSVVYELR